MYFLQLWSQMKRYRESLCAILLLLAFPALLMAQDNIREYYHDLRGMEDTAGVTHLFYRHYQEKFPDSISYYNRNRDDIFRYDVTTGKETLFLEDYSFPGNIILPSQSLIVRDYAFFFRNPDNFIYTSIVTSLDPTSMIEKCDSGCTNIFNTLGDFIKTIGTADSSDLVYVGSGWKTMVSSDGGYHWQGFDASDPNSFINSDSVIPAGFLSVAPYNEHSAFLGNRTDSMLYLEKTVDGGTTLTVVDSLKGISPDWQPHFFYDPDTMHVYAISIPGNSNLHLLYQLRGSGKQGDASSWQTLYQDTTQFFVSLDPGESGVIYFARNRKIYKFANYGSDINLADTPWQILPDTVRGIYKKPGEDIVYALTDSTLFKVTTGGIFTLRQISTAIDHPESSPKASHFILHQNYPNPFNPTTTIRYDLTSPVPVRLEIYNVLGQRVSMLVDDKQIAGAHQVTFDASTLSSGVYFYRLQAGGKVIVKKMLLMK